MWPLFKEIITDNERRMKIECYPFEVKSENCYNYQKLKRKITKSKVPKRAT